MSESRPALTDGLDAGEFRRFYWLKEELSGFCREHGIPAGGHKQDIADRIEHFLKTGNAPPKLQSKNRKKLQESAVALSLDSVITANYTNSEAHRAFFRSVIGPQFHFTQRFMRFCREHPEKTYGDAVAEWLRECEERKTGVYKPEIEPQFEYNRFMREYHEGHPDRSFKDAISAWNVHKQKPKEECK